MVASRDQAILTDVTADARLARRVLYLEGKTDVEPFFALLGQSAKDFTLGADKGAVYQNVLVRGLESEGARGRAPGAGSTAVRARVRVAQEAGVPGVVGITDGDGTSLSTLAPLFDPPATGPDFRWKAYCIESLLAQSTWPSSWGPEPDWSTVLLDYAPYVASNRMRKELEALLDALQLAKFIQPILGAGALLDESTVLARLGAEKGRLTGYDVEAEFSRHVAEFKATLASSVEEAHCLLNGKWLLRHLAPALTGKSPEQCRLEWIEAVRAAGGLPAVRDFWARVFLISP